MFNAVISQLSVFVSAVLYWQYYDPVSAAGDILGAVLNATATNSSALNRGLANVTSTSFAEADANISAANYTLANNTGLVNVRKIDPHILVASVGTLTAIWAMAVLGLTLTIKREYLHTFWSTQTGYAYSQSYFLDNEGSDVKRILIFFRNERHWRSICDRVRKWVLCMYAAWEALKPAWFTDAVKSRIPDGFIPVESLQRENARAPGGRRKTLEDASALRRISLALGSAAVSAADVAPEITSPMPDQLSN